MNATNIAIVFAPTLFKQKDDISIFTDNQDAALLIETMIMDYNKIFRKHIETAKDNNEEQSELKKQLRSTVQQMIPQYIPQIAQAIEDEESKNHYDPLPPDTPTENVIPEGAKLSTDENEALVLMGYSDESKPVKLEMPEELWYFGPISRPDAEKILVACKANSLLVRNSSMQGCYAVSTYDCSSPGNFYFIHYLVVPDHVKGGYKIEECAVDTKTYPTLTNLINTSPVFANFDPAGKFKKN